jgi:hypothetical protein
MNGVVGKFIQTAAHTMARVAALAAILLFAAPTFAQQADTAPAIGRDGPGISWQQLSPEQQQVLDDVKGSWEQLPPGRQVALANGAKRFIGMNATERDQANQRFAEWRKLSERERVEIGERFRLFRGLPPSEKQRLRQAARRFDRMNQEQRQQMRERFQQLTPAQRAQLREQMRERQAPQRRR